MSKYEIELTISNSFYETVEANSFAEAKENFINQNWKMGHGLKYAEGDYKITGMLEEA
jgi:hypothetical protein|tara:strand:+ start:487 stop:660 length:174 start_codon:yes stop_codon:yes gene_type:complete